MSLSIGQAGNGIAKMLGYECPFRKAEEENSSQREKLEKLCVRLSDN